MRLDKPYHCDELEADTRESLEAGKWALECVFADKPYWCCCAQCDLSAKCDLTACGRTVWPHLPSWTLLSYLCCGVAFVLPFLLVVLLPYYECLGDTGMALPECAQLSSVLQNRPPATYHPLSMSRIRVAPNTLMAPSAPDKLMAIATGVWPLVSLRS